MTAYYAPTPAALYHYTCHHGHDGITDRGHVLPARLLDTTLPWDDMPWTMSFAWFTDMAVPTREALGLTSHLIKCDRTLHRYRVLDDAFVEWWPSFARPLSAHMRAELEQAPGARPSHWWVSTAPVPVVYDPRRVDLP